VLSVRGDFAGFPGTRTLRIADLGQTAGVPPDAWTAVRLLRPATQVTLVLQGPGASQVTVSAPRASYLRDDGAFAAMFEPGELTQSLCSPWTHDFRDCGCFYWASNHPDLVLPAKPVGVDVDDPDWAVRTVWLRSNRQGLAPPPPAPGPPPDGAFRRPGEMDYFEINQRWQDLDVVLDGRELRRPYDPSDTGGNPLPPDRVLPSLRYAAGVEVAVMLEYLAAVYSLNPAAGAPNTVLRDDVRAARHQLLLVAIGEMKHLREVNSVLRDLHRRSGGAGPFNPALGVATVLRGSGGNPDRQVRFRTLTPAVMAEFVQIEAPSDTVDGLYSSLLATFERDGDDDLADTIRSVMADGAEHHDTFLAMQEWLGRHNPTDYLRPLRDPPPADAGLGTVQQRYEQVLVSLFEGYRLGLPAGGTRVNSARNTMLGPQGLDGACETLAQRGFLSVFKTPTDSRFAPVPPP